MSREVEAKFVVQHPSVLDAVAAARNLGPFQVVQSAHEQQRNTCLDTAALDLRRAGALLRIREYQDTIELTWKQTQGYVQGVADRLELTAAIQSSQIPQVLHSLVALEPLQRARAVIGQQPLQPLFTYLTDRRKRVLEHHGRQVELAVDRMTVIDGDVVLGTRMEVEVENISATEEEFQQVLAAVRQPFGRDVTLSTVSKSSFAWQLTSQHHASTS